MQNYSKIIRSSTKAIVEGEKTGVSGRWYILNCPLYLSDIVLYNGDQEHCFELYDGFSEKYNLYSKKKIKQELLNYIGSDDNTSNWWCMDTVLDNVQTVVIFTNLRDFNDTEQIGNLSHECLHAALYILNKKGVRDDECGFEALAYLHNWLFENFLEAIKKDITKKKEKKNAQD